eukprot:4334829-Amphidinium_carterae.1
MARRLQTPCFATSFTPWKCLNVFATIRMDSHKVRSRMQVRSDNQLMHMKEASSMPLQRLGMKVWQLASLSVEST